MRDRVEAGEETPAAFSIVATGTTARPHEPDISALLRLRDVHECRPPLLDGPVGDD